MQFKLPALLLLSAALVSANANPRPVADLEDTIKDTVNSFVDWINGIQLPRVDNIDLSVPDNVDKFFDDVENTLKNAPSDLWEKIKANNYPKEIEDWINSLPENLRQEAREDLQEWANEYDTSAAGSLTGNMKVVVYTAGGLTGVLAAALAL